MDFERFLVRLKSLDDTAWEELIRLVDGYLFAIAYRRVGNTHTAMEIVQDTYVDAINSIGRFQREGASITTLKAWLAAIARNNAVDHFRRPVLPIDGSASENLDERLMDDSSKPSQYAMDKERIDKFRALLDRLSSENREVLVLRNEYGLSYADIAAVLGIPNGTVKSRLHRGWADLARLMKEENGYWAQQ